jgi:hypothetical protein
LKGKGKKTNFAAAKAGEIPLRGMEKSVVNKAAAKRIFLIKRY